MSNIEISGIQIKSLSDDVHRLISDHFENKRLDTFLNKVHSQLVYKMNGDPTLAPAIPIETSLVGNLSSHDLDDMLEIGNPVEGMEHIYKIIKFSHAYGKLAHEEHRRKSGEPYDKHPTSAMIHLSKYGVSYKALIAMRLHDVVEERAAAEISEDDPFAPLKTKAMFYSIGLELYNYVKQDTPEKYHKRFFKDIHIIMRIIGNMTNMGEASYPYYIREQVFYAATPGGSAAFRINPRDLVPFLGGFHGVDDLESLVNDYARDVDGLRFPARELMDEENKIRRRTIMCKLSDMIVNIEDMEPDYLQNGGLPINFRLWEYFKGLLLTNEVGVKQHRLPDTTKEYFDRIMMQCTELRITFLREIDRDISYLESRLDKDYVGFIRHFIADYQMQESSRKLTKRNNPEDVDAAYAAYIRMGKTSEHLADYHYRKGNPFDGTLGKFIKAIYEDKSIILNEKDGREIYKDLVTLRAIIKNMHVRYLKTGVQPSIGNLGSYSIGNYYRNNIR